MQLMDPAAAVGPDFPIMKPTETPLSVIATPGAVTPHGFSLTVQVVASAIANPTTISVLASFEADRIMANGQMPGMGPTEAPLLSRCGRP